MTEKHTHKKRFPKGSPIGHCPDCGRHFVKHPDGRVTIVPKMEEVTSDDSTRVSEIPRTESEGAGRVGEVDLQGIGE